MIVRTDLKMRKGKIAAQCCHGSIGAYKKSPAEKIKKWENEAYAKVVLKVQTKEELIELKKLADEIKIYESWNELVSAERPK